MSILEKQVEILFQPLENSFRNQILFSDYEPNVTNNFEI